MNQTTIDTAQTITQLIESNVITSIPLLDVGETIKTKAAGLHEVTGGYILTVPMGPESSIFKIYGIYIPKPPGFTGVYSADQVEFNRNFACVLHEMKAAGLTTLSPSKLDGAHAPGIYWNYLRSFKEAKKMPMRSMVVNNIVNLSDNLVDTLGG